MKYNIARSELTEEEMAALDVIYEQLTDSFSSGRVKEKLQQHELHIKLNIAQWAKSRNCRRSGSNFYLKPPEDRRERKANEAKRKPTNQSLD